jgi:hypothetical protein
MTTFQFRAADNTSTSVSATEIGATISKMESGITRHDEPCVNCQRQTACAVCTSKDPDDDSGKAATTYVIRLSGFNDGDGVPSAPAKWSEQVCPPNWTPTLTIPWSTVNLSVAPDGSSKVNGTYMIQCESGGTAETPTCGGQAVGNFVRRGNFVYYEPFAGEYESGPGSAIVGGYTVGYLYPNLRWWGYTVELLIGGPSTLTTLYDLAYEPGYRSSSGWGRWIPPRWSPTALRKAIAVPRGISVIFRAGSGVEPHANPGGSNSCGPWPITVDINEDFPAGVGRRYGRQPMPGYSMGLGSYVASVWTLPFADLADCELNETTLTNVASSDTSWNPGFAGGVGPGDSVFSSTKLAEHAKWERCPAMSCSITSLASGQKSSPADAGSGAGADLGGVEIG